MKFRALVITILFAAGVAASVAVAKGPPPGKGKKQQTAVSSTTGSTSASVLACKPAVSVILKGDFVSGSGSDDEGVFQVKVRQANRHGKRFVAETVTIAYDERTRFIRRGHAEIGDFEAGDLLNVHARACKEQKAKKPKKPKRGSTTTASTSTATTTGSSTSGSTSTGAGAGSPELLAKRVTGRPGKSSGTTSGTTTTAP